MDSEGLRLTICDSDCAFSALGREDDTVLPMTHALYECISVEEQIREGLLHLPECQHPRTTVILAR